MTQQEFQQRYNVSERLGEGGFGEVFKAYDKVRLGGLESIQSKARA